MIRSFSFFLLKTGIGGLFLTGLFLTKSLYGQWSSTSQWTASSSQSTCPSVLVDSSGNIYLICISNNSGNLFLQASVNPILTGIWSVQVAISNTSESVLQPPALIKDSSGYFVVCWTSTNGTTTTAQANVLSPLGLWSGPTVLSNSSNFAYQVGVDLNHAGSPFVYWTEFDGTYYTIQASVFNP